MNAEVVTIGAELLLGQIVDTNAQWLAQQLAGLGLRLQRKTTVGDDTEQIVAALRMAMAASRVVVTSGGLGPTVDDKTREAVALATERDLVLDRSLLAGIEAMFHSRGWTLGGSQQRQAFVPAGAVPMPNPVGTAPCFAVEHRGCWIVVLPGVPRELKYMFTNVVAPFLRERVELTTHIRSRTFRTVGIGEGPLGDLLHDVMEAAHPAVGTLAHPGMVDVRAVVTGEDLAAADRLLDEVEATVRQRLGASVYGLDGETLAQVVVRGLAERGLTLAVAETNTSGRLAQLLLEAPGGPPVLRGGLVLGSDELVREVATLPPDTPLASAETAGALAAAARRQLGADTGLALVSTTRANVSRFDPNPGQTFLALATGGDTYLRQEPVGGTNELSVALLAAAALDFVRRTLLD